MHGPRDLHAPDAAPVPTDWILGAQRDLPDPSVYDMFQRRVIEAPDAPAAHGDHGSLTFRELDDASTAVASRLIDTGVPAGSRVGVFVERSGDLLIGLLAAWKAGCAYLPLDTDHPAERIEFFLSDAGAAAVLTRVALAHRVPPGIATVVTLDDAPEGRHPIRRPAAQDAAYLIYTSGSTGRPKAVEVEHRSLANVVAELGRVLRVGPGERWLTMAPPTFDISLAELCIPLASGAAVTVASVAEVRDATRLVGLIHDQRITRMQAVPSQWQALVDAGLDAPHLVGMTGGEALPVRLAAALTARLGGIVNGYGPTETTIVATIWPVPAGLAPTSSEQIRIGRPIANTRAYVLDDDLTEVPVGVAGELFIAGAGVARGYAGDDALTARAFLPDMRGRSGERMYRTGDRARWSADGELEYLGRTDGQVKIRGQRVELGEVEAGIGTHPQVGSVVAVVRDHELVAFVVPADPAAPPTASQIRDHTARTLTSAMAPTAVTILEAFPLTANGKIDRAALAATPLPTVAPAEAADAGEPFTVEFCALVRDVLGADRVVPADDFFDVGGHSLAVMRVAAAILEKWKVQVASDVFYDTETVADLASAVNALRVSR